MHKQYFSVLKFPINLRILKNSTYPPFEGIRSLLVYQKEFNVRSRRQTVSTFTNLVNPTFFSHSSLNFIKHFSQQNARPEDLTDEKSDKSSSLHGDSNTPLPPQPHSVDKDHQCCASGNQMNDSDLFEDINYNEITEGDEEKLNQFKLLMLEIDVQRQDGMNVPSKLSTEDWKELFSLQSRNQRRKYLTFLFKTEMKKLGDKRKKELKRLAKLEQPIEETDDSDHIQYGFRGSTIFLRVYDTTMNLYDNYRLIRAMMFGQDLVIDCGFYNDMNSMENKLCCKQLIYLFAENRIGKEPFNLHFCNLKKDSSIYYHMKKSIPTIEDPDFPINIYEEHYLDLFPKEKLVYLTPHCRTELKEYNHDDIYIIGAIVDRVNTQPLTLAKAKSEGLRMAHLPLDRYLEWAIGNKSLTINQVLMIMHDVQITGDWVYALKNVPQRKIRRPGEPIRDNRKPWNRGTTFQPPQRFKKYY